MLCRVSGRPLVLRNPPACMADVPVMITPLSHHHTPHNRNRLVFVCLPVLSSLHISVSSHLCPDLHIHVCMSPTHPNSYNCYLVIVPPSSAAVFRVCFNSRHTYPVAAISPSAHILLVPLPVNSCNCIYTNLCPVFLSHLITCLPLSPVVRVGVSHFRSSCVYMC